ncbi:MAG: ATP-binding cassette domain-containing protein, partial [Methanosarcinaceae archaeon]|nr:ATP-binding cassette domain-containing protein [Methanosarcinaceae archaeon]
MNENPISPPETHPLLELKNISVVLGGKKILDSVSLSLNPGENLAIIGPNGSGKSTLIKTFTKEYHPLAGAERGSLKIMGKEHWNVFELRNFLGIVSGSLQQTYVRPIPVLDVLISGFFSSIGIYSNHKITPGMQARALKTLDFLEISHLSDRLMSEISSGEARRVLIGRALVHDPKVLVLDEPANSLDLRGMHSFRESVRKIAASGKSIILVTHNLEDVIPEIGWVVLLRDGKILKDGPKEEVLTGENLSALFS